MANINEVAAGIWTGGDLPFDRATAEEHVAEWRGAGITHVIDNRMEWSDEELVAELDPSTRYLHNGVDDAGQVMPDWWFDEAVEFALEALAGGGGVLLHCHMGINRGPSAAYALLLALGGDPVEAIDLIRAKRPIAAVGYAEDALAWWHRRSAAPADVRETDRRRLAEWRRANPHDTVRIIREIRDGESAA